ncbi:MAG: PilZ domain-containing protein [Chitinispirillaceae bacterium]|nr:PilZ domain-containing protein [Chitinispirillaceae bacterium]
MQYERRKEQRKTLKEPAEITFYSNGGLHFGSMIDLSIGGACFSIHHEKPGKMPALSKDRPMECYITTTDGTSKCSGNVRWIRHYDSRFKLGISFAKLSNDEDEPLRVTIRRYFKPENGGQRRRLR